MAKFGVYVNKATAAESGYVTADGRVSPRQRDAQRFDHMALAVVRSIDLGFELDAHAKPGVTTAYACHLL